MELSWRAWGQMWCCGGAGRREVVDVCFLSLLLAGSNVPRKFLHLRLNELADSASYEVIWGIQSTKIDTAFGSNVDSVMDPADIIDLVSLHEIFTSQGLLIIRASSAACCQPSCLIGGELATSTGH